MSQYAVYDADGRITGMIQIPDDTGERSFLPPDPAESVEVPNDMDPEERHNLIVQGGKVEARRRLPGALYNASIRADGVERRVIQRLPEKTLIKESRGGLTILTAEEDLEITATEPGLYEIEIDPFPYRPFKVVVDAHD